jgi:hypothetical protein
MSVLRHRHPFRHLARAVAVLALVLGGGALAPAAASAEDAEPIWLGQCAWMGDGEMTVPAGAPLNLLNGWATGPRGSLVHWLKSQQSSVTVQHGDGEPTTWDATDRWSALERDKSARMWMSTMEWPVTAPAAGETMTVTFTTWWTKTVNDLFFALDEQRPPFRWLSKGGEMEMSCVFTGE